MYICPGYTIPKTVSPSVLSFIPIWVFQHSLFVVRHPRECSVSQLSFATTHSLLHLIPQPSFSHVVVPIVALVSGRILRCHRTKEGPTALFHIKDVTLITSPSHRIASHCISHRHTFPKEKGFGGFCYQVKGRKQKKEPDNESKKHMCVSAYVFARTFAKRVSFHFRHGLLFRNQNPALLSIELAFR